MDTATTTPATTPANARHPDRFFLAIVGGLVALLVVAAISVAIARRPAQTLPADSPEGTVQRFLAALEQRDYQGAYALLSDQMTRKPTFEAFMRQNASRQSNEPAQRVTIVHSQVSEDVATVDVSITHYSTTTAPFVGTNEYTTQETFTLRRTDGTWRITSLPYEYGSPYYVK